MENLTTGVHAVAEPISVTLGILASVLRIAVSIKQLIAKGLSRPDAVAAFLKTAKSNERDLLNTGGMQDAILEITVISNKLLEQYAKEAARCEELHIEGRDQAQTQIAKNLADQKAAECMCNVLRGIIQHNAMKLPSEFQGWWTQYNCAL